MGDIFQKVNSESDIWEKLCLGRSYITYVEISA